MNLKTNQYLEFPTRIAKINEIDGNIIKLRNFSFGRTKTGYDYQSEIKKSYLLNYIKIGKVKCISPLFIMELLLKTMKGGTIQKK